MNDQYNPVGTDQTEIATKENGRRRLVRGAVSLAPIVLTLRSGALAAASCTGAKSVNYPIPQTGELPSGTVEGDVCIKNIDVCDGNKVVTMQVSPVNYQYVGPNTKCNNFQSQTVAILSSASATSLGIPKYQKP
jgi:hypothetical protein